MKKLIIGIVRPRHRYYQIKNGYLFLKGLFLYYKTQKLTKTQKEFARHLSLFKPKTFAKAVDGILLVQMVKDYEYAIKLAASSKVIAEKNNFPVLFYETNWTSWIGWYKRYPELYTRLSPPPLEKIYHSFGKSVVFKTEEKFYDQSFIRQELSKLLSQTKTREDVLNLKFETVLVGDLIYDTYLRYFSQPTVEIIDKELTLVIEIALNIYYNFRHFLKNNKVKCLLNTYSTYIEHGIPARICLEENIDVYTIASHSYVIQKLTKEFPYHQINHSLFYPDKKLSEEQLELA
jgi:hypothetical protein